MMAARLGTNAAQRRRRVQLMSERSGWRPGSTRKLPSQGQIKNILTNLKRARPPTITDLPAPTANRRAAGRNREIKVTCGRRPGHRAERSAVTLLFRSGKPACSARAALWLSPIGRVPTQIDFADYRDVNGIKLPFRIHLRVAGWARCNRAERDTDKRSNGRGKFGRPAPLK
jgi:hypothetical protein